MTADLEKLLPCPFCGGNNLTVFDNNVFCGDANCGGSGPDLGHCVGPKCRADAIAAWNTRALPAENAALRARVAELEAEVHTLQEVVNAEEERANDANARAEAAEGELALTRMAFAETEALEEQHGAVIQRLQAELARRGQVQVKPLEWRKTSRGYECLDGEYRISSEEEGYEVSFYDEVLAFIGRDSGDSPLSEARSVAQNHHESRIRAALVSPGDEPSEYEKKVAQMKEDFPNGI